MPPKHLSGRAWSARLTLVTGLALLSACSGQQTARPTDTPPTSATGGLEQTSDAGGGSGASGVEGGGAGEVAGGDAGGDAGGASGGGAPAELSFEERLVMGLPVGPERARFDCRSIDSFEPPWLAAHDPLCPLELGCQRPLVVAHRGAGGDLGYLAPENSLSAIRLALLVGVDGVELDVRTSADDELVVIHDATVDRTTTGSGAVSEMSLAELKALSLTPPPLRHPLAGEADFSCERIPTLREALSLTKGRLFVDLDMKTSRAELVLPLLIELELLDEVYISVSTAEVAAQARAIEPRARVQVRPDSPAELEEIDALFESERSPEMIEVPSQRLEAFSAQMEGREARLFTDGWGADFRAQAGELSAYTDLYQRGAEVVQSELPLLILEALERDVSP